MSRTADAFWVGAALLDDRLNDLLRVKFSLNSHAVKHAVDPLFDTMGPLATFSTRIKLAYALDLLPEYCFSDLERIRRIRNLAAHACSSMSFESQEIVVIVSALKGAERLQDWGKIDQLIEKLTVSKERLRFMLTVSFLAGFMDGRMSSLGPRRINEGSTARAT